MTWNQRGIRFVAASRILVLASLAFSSCASPSIPPPTQPPAEELQPATGSFIFLEGNDCTQDVVGETSSSPGQFISLQDDARFGNDEARSVVLLNVEANTQLSVFDSPASDQDDDWTMIIAKRTIDVYCVATFERTFEDEAVQVIHLHKNGLDGKVSRIEVGVGSPIVTSAGPPEPSAVATPPTNTPVPTEAPTSPPTIPSVTEVACVPTATAREIARVTRIVDGDTIDVEIDGASFRVRYIGMDTPERGRPFFDEATRRNASLVEGRTVTLIKDVSETDRYDRLLRYVLVGSIFVNYELVRDGYALAFTYPPDVACSEDFVEAQRQALSEGRGLWAATPTSYPTSPPPPAQSECHPSYEGVCLKVGIGDYDCAGGSGNGPNYVEGPFRVVGYDEFGLDREGDGLACE